MRVLIAGAGYVGLTTGACLAHLGHQVLCYDPDGARVAMLRRGALPFYEPGLADIFLDTHPSRLDVCDALPQRLAEWDAILVCVGTPSGSDGQADLSAFDKLVEDLTPGLSPGQLIVTKSTVPPGTNRTLAARCAAAGVPARVVSNPEFLREGSAVADFFSPDRIVFGVADAAHAAAADRLFSGIRAPRLTTGWEAAELIKYAANAFLAVRVSFINEMGRLCSAYRADVAEVAHGVGMDRRIGQGYLSAGIGYGGSCLPKDVAALQHIAADAGIELPVVAAAATVNRGQTAYVCAQLAELLGGVSGRKIAVWGLAFKPGTDDVRSSPACALALRLLAAGAEVWAHDPLALENARRYFAAADIGPVLTGDPWAAAAGASALIIATDWPEYRSADLGRLRTCLAAPILLDGRNALSPEAVTRAGLTYLGVGRAVATAPVDTPS